VVRALKAVDGSKTGVGINGIATPSVA